MAFLGVKDVRNAIFNGWWGQNERLTLSRTWGVKENFPFTQSGDRNIG
jgi:hypothetical protein